MKGSSKLFGKLSLIMAIIIIAVSVSGVFANAAASYNGSGTKADPYIVETAEQLDGIRNNLEAHYKLGNTIEMSGSGNFLQIGNLSKPFKGSFVCDTDSSGKPLYAIKGLKVYNAAGEKAGHKLYDSSSYGDYIKNGSKWEAGLFGATNGASFENILVLDADITNTVIGQNQQNPDSTWNPGQDEMGTGVLVGIAENTYFSGCGVSGKINSKSNHCGGFAGSMRSSIAEKCYSTATVSTTGFWCHGGFVGSLSAQSSLDSCMATVNLTDETAADAGGFVGSLGNSSITDCAVTGKVQKGAAFSGDCTDSSSTITNCFSSVTSSGSSEIKDEKAMYTAENSFTLTGTTAQKKFTQSSIDAIKSALGANSKWDVSGAEPKIAGMVVVTDSSSFVPGAVTAVTSPQSGGTEVGQTQTASASSNASSQEETASLADFTAIMDKISDPEKVTLKDKENLKKAKKMYESFSDQVFNEMPAEYIQKFTTAVKNLSILMISDIVSRVEKLPEVSKISSKDKTEVLEIYGDYQFLSDEYKKMIAQKYVDKLQAAYEAVQSMTDNAVSTSTRPLTNVEKVIVGILIFLIVAVLGFHAFAVIYISKKKKGGVGIDEK